jgi:nicotinamide mononucleotide adenylyltransferase
MEINIKHYLSDDEIKEIIKEEIKESIKKLLRDEKNFNRILSNSAYSYVEAECEKIIPNFKNVIVEKVSKLVNEEKYNYYVFNDGSYSSPKSQAYLYIEEFVRNNKPLFMEKITNELLNNNHSEKVWNIFEKLGSNFNDLLFDIVEIGKKLHK